MEKNIAAFLREDAKEESRTELLSLINKGN